MIAFREGSENGGPYNSNLRIINSNLKEKYKFVPLIVPKGRMGLFNIRIIKNLVAQINSVHPDVVQIIGLELIGYYLALACHIAKIKNVIVAIHGSTTESIEFNRNPFKKFIMEQLEKFTLKTGKLTFGVSDYVYSIKNVAKCSKNYFGTIYNMLLIDQNIYNINDVKKELNIDNDCIVVMSTGRITEEKGFGVLTKVIKHYYNDSKIIFVIAGDGEYKQKMEELLAEQIINGQVKLLGYRSDISKILTAGDIFVMSSYHETLCMSLLEAGQKGLALIGSDVGGIREIISDGDNGYLVKVGDFNGIIEKINILKDIEILNNMKQRAKESIITKFSNDITIKKLDLLYTNIIEENS